MILKIVITDELLERILSYGDILLDDMSQSQLDQIQANFESSILSRIEDEPHYAYEDCIDGLFS